MGAETPRMHDALGNALVIKVKDFLAEMKVLERRRPAAPDSQRVLVVSDRGSLLGRHDRDVASRHLMRLAAFTANNCLTPKGCDLAFAVNLAATRRALRHYASRKRLGRSSPDHAHGERRAARSVACLWRFPGRYFAASAGMTSAPATVSLEEDWRRAAGRSVALSGHGRHISPITVAVREPKNPL